MLQKLVFTFFYLFKTLLFKKTNLNTKKMNFWNVFKEDWKHPISQVNQSQNTKRHPYLRMKLTCLGIFFIPYKNSFFFLLLCSLLLIIHISNFKVRKLYGIKAYTPNRIILFLLPLKLNIEVFAQRVA